jgi:hypothetical protein
MDTLALKLTVTPLLILAASLAGRRWGDAVGGWLVGLPLTSGPVCFFLALDQGAGFATAAGLGCLGGAAAEAAFCFGYGLAARRFGWPLALVAASSGFIVGAVVAAIAGLPLWPLVVAVCAALAGALLLMPAPGNGAFPAAALPRWDIPARMAVATALVLAVTTLAPRLGPRLSGLLATYPIFAAVLAVFGHHARGPGAAIKVLRGLLTGLFAFTGFFAVLVVSLERAGIAAAFVAATALALAIQAISLQLMRRRAASPAPILRPETRVRAKRQGES